MEHIQTLLHECAQIEGAEVGYGHPALYLEIVHETFHFAQRLEVLLFAVFDQFLPFLRGVGIFQALQHLLQTDQSVPQVVGKGVKAIGLFGTGFHDGVFADRAKRCSTSSRLSALMGLLR